MADNEPQRAVFVRVEFKEDEFALLTTRSAQAGKEFSEYAHDVIVKGLNRWDQKRQKKTVQDEG